MNERIRELAVEATIHSPEGFYTYTQIDAEKFAELIVAECIDVFSKDMPDPTSADYQLGSLPEVVNSVCNVAEHFGVER